jgi:NADH:ubiquinone oxidoreductase subunit 6 (subunit J)
MDVLQQTLRFVLVENWHITLTAVLGAVGVCLLLPRPRSYPVWWGVVAGTAALLLAGVLLLQSGPLTAGTAPEVVLFYLFSAVAIVSGALLITQRNPARAALSFALVVLSTSGLFLLQAAPFLMAGTVIIYAGAIIVTFLFVIMLAQQEGMSDADHRSREPLLSAAAGFVLLGALLFVLHVTYGTEDLDHFRERVTLLHVDAEVAQEKAADATTPDVVKDIEGLAQGVSKLRDDFNDWSEKGLRGSPERVRDNLTHVLGGLDTALVEVKRQQFLLRERPQAAGEGINKALTEMTTALDHLGKGIDEARNTLGIVQVQPGEPLSDFSGPAANVPLNERRTDAQGRPELPAENVAYLGRSLFTDYLLAVELAGMLLLVATIGAIAIAHRRGDTNP